MHHQVFVVSLETMQSHARADERIAIIAMLNNWARPVRLCVRAHHIHARHGFSYA
jgi:hypothetical protein